MSMANKASKGEVISVEKSLEISPSKGQASSPVYGSGPRAQTNTRKSAAGNLKESGFHTPRKGGAER